LEVVAVSHDGLYCAAGAPSGKLYLWQVATGRMLKAWDGHYKGVTALSWTTDAMFLLSGGEDALFSLWSLGSLFGCSEEENSTGQSTIQPEHTWNEHALPITSIFCGVGGISGRIVTTSKDQTCKMWDIPSRRMVASLKFPSCLTTITMDILEQRLFVGSIDGRIYCVDLSMPPQDTDASLNEDGEDICDTLSAHNTYISSLSVCLDGSLLVSSSHDGTTKMWDLRSRQVIRTFSNNKGPVVYSILISNPFMVDPSPEDASQTSNKTSRMVQAFKTFLHRNEQSAYSTGDGSNLLASMATPIFLANTRSFFPDLLEEEESVAFFSDIMSTEGKDGVLEQHNRSLQLQVEQLQTQVARWKDVNNDLYNFCVTQLLTNAGSATTSGKVPPKN